MHASLRYSGHCYIRTYSRGTRHLHQSSIALKNNKSGAAAWVNRRKRDVLIKQTVTDSWRCRSAFKLVEIDDKFRILKPGDVVIDCGSAPGSWTQVAVERVNALGKAEGPIGHVIGIDLLALCPVPGATSLEHMDFTDPANRKVIIDKVQANSTSGYANTVLSDMSPRASGIKMQDHQESCRLFLSALRFSLDIIPEGGHFISKLLQGYEDRNVRNIAERFYKKVSIFKPNASYSDSTEIYIVAQIKLKLDNITL